MMKKAELKDVLLRAVNEFVDECDRAERGSGRSTLELSVEWSRENDPATTVFNTVWGRTWSATRRVIPAPEGLFIEEEPKVVEGVQYSGDVQVKVVCPLCSNLVPAGEPHVCPARVKAKEGASVCPGCSHVILGDFEAHRSHVQACGVVDVQKGLVCPKCFHIVVLGGSPL